MAATPEPAAIEPPEVGFPQRLRIARERKNLTQVEAAARCGVSEKTWGSWEKGARVTHYALVVVGLAHALKVPVEWLDPTSDMRPYRGSDLQLRLPIVDDDRKPESEPWTTAPSWPHTAIISEGEGFRRRRADATTPSTNGSLSGWPDAA